MESDQEIEEINDLSNLVVLFDELDNFKYNRDKLSLLILPKNDSMEEFNIICDFERDIVSEQDKRLYEKANNSIGRALRELDLINIFENEDWKMKYFCTRTRLLIRKGIGYRMMGQQEIIFYKAAIESFNEALEISKKISNQDYRNYYNIFCNISLADVYRVSSDLKKGEDFIVQAQSILRKINKENNKEQVDLSLGFFYNQFGLISLQKWTKDSSTYQYLVMAQNYFYDSIKYFWNLREKRWIFKSFIDLCGCIYLMYLLKTPSKLNSVDLIIQFLNRCENLSNFPTLQAEHNIALNKAKFLLLKNDQNSLQQAEKTIKTVIKKAKKQKQERALGAELVTLGKIQLFQKNKKKGFSNIKKGFKLLNSHPQVRIINLLEIKIIFKKITEGGIYSIEEMNNLISQLSGDTENSLTESKPKDEEISNIIVFFSHATLDAELYEIEELAKNLKRFDSIDDVLYWQEGMVNITEFMNDGIGRCNILVLFCSENAEKSDPVKKEWNAVFAMRKPIIPVFLNIKDIPALLRSNLGVEYNEFDLVNNVRELYRKILQNLKNLKNEN